MSFLSRRRSAGPRNSPRTSSPPPSKEKVKESHSTQPVNDSSKTPRSRSDSDASVFKRVSTIFGTRRRTSSKISVLSSQGQYNGSAGIGYTSTTLPRLSSESTPPSSPEIRRPSGLGRRASLLESEFNESSGSVAVSEGYRGGEGSAVAHAGFTSLPNLLGGGFCRLSEIITPKVDSELEPKPGHQAAPEHGFQPLRLPDGFPLPDQLLRIVLQFLPKHDLPLTALVSRDFCSAARHVLYHDLDIRTIAESQVKRLYNVLARKKELAELIISFYCPSWSTSSEGNDTPIPPHVFRHVLHNMGNLKILSIPSFACILAHAPSPTFSLTHFTILDERMTQSQLREIRLWLTTQSCLESLALPNLVECKNTETLPLELADEWVPVGIPWPESEDTFPITPLPNLESLQASTQIVGTLCSLQHSIRRLTLDVHDTLYSGLRPSTVLRPFKGVRDMKITFAPGVDKRTVEKFLSVTGCLLAGEGDKEGLRSLQLEVFWTDRDAAETLYGIMTSVINRFRGLQKLKLTSPFRSVQTPTPPPASTLSLLPLPTPLPSPTRSVSGGSVFSTQSSMYASTPRGGAIEREFVSCGVEKGYAKTWTSRCPSLADIQFDFSCSKNESDVELCGVWFRRKAGGGTPARAGM